MPASSVACSTELHCQEVVGDGKWASARRLPHKLNARVRVLLIVLLAVAVIVAGIAYNQRAAIRALLTGSHAVGGDPALTYLRLPPGFSATLYASGLNGLRFFTFGPDSTVFAAERNMNRIVAFGPPDAAGKATSRTVVVSGLDDPNSVI